MEAGPEKLLMNVTKVTKTLRSGNKFQLLSSSTFHFPYNCLQNNPNLTFHSHYHLSHDEIKSPSVLKETSLKTQQHIAGGSESQDIM